jgi:predicted RNA-binding protein with PIN domain
MHYLIDGYNLLHAMGVVQGRLGPDGLEKARLRLLGLLRGAYGVEEASRVTVVFDAAGAPPGATEVSDYKGIRVRFAVRQPEADDLIESLIGQDSAPKNLRVVSDDQRVQQAARRRRCTAVGCAEYLEWLQHHRRQRLPRDSRAAGKPEAVSEAEAQWGLRAFAALQDDPDAKALFELDNFAVDEVEEGP